jgi:hypothetical protein
MEAGGAGGDQCEQSLGRSPVADVHHFGAQLGGDDGPDIIAGIDKLEIGEDFRDFFAAVFDFGEDILRQRAINKSACLEKFDELIVVHEAGTVRFEISNLRFEIEDLVGGAGDQSRSDMVA